MKRELHLPKHELELFNLLSDLRTDKWKAFKEYNITQVTMNILLKQLGEDYFRQAKHVRNKNMEVVELSSHAVEFFKVFLKTERNS